MASSSSKHQQLIMRLYTGRLSVPALSFLALVTGFTFSLAVSSSLQALLPVMESLFLVSLPHLWQASLSWITPPCLFVILNGIIMILTAISARSSSSSCDAGSSELMEPNLPTQIESVSFKQTAAKLVHVLAEPHGSMSATAKILDDTLQIGGPLGMHTPLAHSLHAENDTETVELEAPSQYDGYGDADDKQLALYMNHQDASACVSIAKIDPEHDATGGDPPTSSSLACQEKVKAGSEPSSPYFSSSPAHVKSNIRRSMSIDSVPFTDNSEGGSSSEQLSEEAFKKIIDDFILKVNSKIRSETRVSMG